MAPGFVAYAVLIHDAVVVVALVVDVGLDLVDRRCDFVVDDEVDEPVGEEVGHADGAHAALVQEFLHRPPGAVVVVEGLVDEVEVDVVQTEPGQRSSERGLGGVVAGVFHP